MIIVMGLGNIGRKFSGHRHNIGFHVLDSYAAQKGAVWQEEPMFHAAITRVGDLLLAKPTTFMNNSGLAARALTKQYGAQLVIVHDEINVPLGTIKCSVNRGSGGHNGLESIIEQLGHKDFFRIRVGVRPVHEELLPKIAPPDGFETYLLSDFAPFEAEGVQEGMKKAIDVIELLQTDTFTDIMNKYN
jgi:peptidyl-tRNA hydrolase, PTH1 family